MKRSLLLLVITAVSLQTALKAQSSYAQVYQLIQTHCAGSSCHDGSTPTFNINVSADSFYHEILNATPVNPAAAGNFNKLVSPGDVQHSFLLRKIAHGISDGLKLNQPSEGLDMPQGLPALAKNEIELVRQWILYGAPKTGDVVDTATINTYYRTGGIDDVYNHPAPPAPGTGFQIYYGRFFVKAGISDTEVYYKVDPHLTQATESYKIDFLLPSDDHHFILYLFQPGGDVNYPWGIRPIENGSMEYDLYGIGGTGTWTIDLPPNTAFYFNPGQMFDLDLHLTNPHIDSIYSCEMYVNIYTEPANTTNNYMKMASFVNMDIVIPKDGQYHTFPLMAQDSSRTNYWNIWKMSSHTHRYGTGFNMWLKNPDGSKGAKIYNGNYSYEDGYDVGYYRWGPHATTRTFPNDSLFPVNPLTGIISEATWKNTAGPDTVWWGFSSLDEMEAIYFYYIDGAPLSPSGINAPVSEDGSAKVFPNPVVDEFVLKYELTEPANVQIDLLDLLGNKITNLVTEQVQTTGQYTHGFSTADHKLSAGIYIVAFNIGGKTETQKLIITE